MSRRLFAVLPFFLLNGASAQAGPVATYSFTCNLNGAMAKMVSQVETLPDGYGGFVTRSAGEIRSHNAYYSFVGEGEYADMVDRVNNQRFRIRFELVPGGMFIVSNPFESGHGYEGSGRYWCQADN